MKPDHIVLLPGGAIDAYISEPEKPEEPVSQEVVEVDGDDDNDMLVSKATFAVTNATAPVE